MNEPNLEELAALEASVPPAPWWWERCYELDDLHWAVCDAKSHEDNRVTNYQLVMESTSEAQGEFGFLNNPCTKVLLDARNALPWLIERAKLAARYEAALLHFGSMASTSLRVNTPEWMELLADELNKVCEVIGDADRWKFDGWGLTKVRAS